MLEGRYILLRSRRSRDVVYRDAQRSSSRGDERTLATLSLDVVDAAEATKAKADRDCEVIAPAMPMMLIAPVRRASAGAAPRSATPGWGIRAVGADTCPFTGDKTVVAVV